MLSPEIKVGDKVLVYYQFGFSCVAELTEVTSLFVVADGTRWARDGFLFDSRSGFCHIDDYSKEAHEIGMRHLRHRRLIDKIERLDFKSLPTATLEAIVKLAKEVLCADR